MKEKQPKENQEPKRASRRKFLKIAGEAVILAGITAAACGVRIAVTELTRSKKSPFEHEIEISPNTKRLLYFINGLYITPPDELMGQDIRGFLNQDGSFWGIFNWASQDNPFNITQSDIEYILQHTNSGEINPDVPTNQQRIYELFKYNPGHTVFDPESKTIKGWLGINGELRKAPGYNDLGESYVVFRRFISQEKSIIQITRQLENPNQLMEYEKLTEEEIGLLTEHLQQAFESRIYPAKSPEQP